MTARTTSGKVPRCWGVTPEERGRTYPCDAYVENPRETWYRGVDVASSPGVLFRWICQLRVAPYSYDWIDNLGRPSPRHLTPGLGDLAVGQRVMFVFEVAEFERGRRITLVLRGRRLRRTAGPVAMTYEVSSSSESPLVRLVVKIVIGGPWGTAPAWVRVALSWGDLVMMRRQLQRLAQLAERDSLAGCASAPGEI